MHDYFLMVSTFYLTAVGADILDVTNQNTETFGELEEENSHFELSRPQRVQWETMQRINLYIREEYHAIQDLIWKDGYTNILRGLPVGFVIFYFFLLSILYLY